MCPRPVVVLDVLQQDLEQMPFADHDDVVQAFSSNRADHPLGIRVLPRRAGRNDGLLDIQHPGLMRKSFSIDLVSVPNQIPGPSSSAHASSSWRAVHSAVGCAVTLKCTSRRRLWVSTTSTNRTRKVAVAVRRDYGSANLPNRTAFKTALPALLPASSPRRSCLWLAHPTCAQRSLS